MAVPDFQAWFLPFLKHLADGKNHRLSDLYEDLAKELALSADDRSEMLPSGKQLKYKNRIGWARTYMKKAGLIESPARGECRITSRGLEVLANPPDRLTVKFLKQFPEFKEFHTYKPSAPLDPHTEADDDSGATPEEALEQAHQTLKDDVTQELLDRVKSSHPSFFEALVVELLLRMGYGGSREDAGKTIGRSGDGGIDGVIKEDRLGLDFVLHSGQTLGEHGRSACGSSVRGEFRGRAG